MSKGEERKEKRVRVTIGSIADVDDMSPEIMALLGITPEEIAKKKLEIKDREAVAAREFFRQGVGGVDKVEFVRAVEGPKPSCVVSSAKPAVAKDPDEKTASAGSGAGGR